MTLPKVALYLRLSREDGETGQSQSIHSQRQALDQFLQGKGWQATEVYIDDGWSGMRFQRPGFLRMLADIRQGKIDTVVLKDLSRLGRDHIQTGYYLEVYFPQHNIRCLSLSESYDSQESGGVSQLIPFYFALNDLYAQDISRKVRTSLNARKMAGRFIGSSPPFGYRRDTADPGRLIPDSETAGDVRLLWARFLQTGSISDTARWLSKSQVLTPSARKEGSQGAFHWNQTMVRNILTNPTYAGHLTQNRSQRLGPKLPQKRAIPPESWITVENTHQALVSQEEFDHAQRLLAKRSYRRGNRQPHPLSGLAVCADCGMAMSYVKESPQRTYMVCQGYRRGGKEKCSPHRVREDQVLEALGDALRQLVAENLDGEAMYQAVVDRLEGESHMNEELLRRRERNHRMRLQLYQDTAEGRLSQEDHRRILAELDEERKKWEERRPSTGDYRARMEELLAFQPPHRALLTALVERVVIHENKQVEVYLTTGSQ